METNPADKLIFSEEWKNVATPYFRGLQEKAERTKRLKEREATDVAEIRYWRGYLDAIEACLDAPRRIQAGLTLRRGKLKSPHQG